MPMTEIQRVLADLDAHPDGTPLDEIADRTGYGLTVLQLILHDLELKSLVYETMTGRWGLTGVGDEILSTRAEADKTH